MLNRKQILFINMVAGLLAGTLLGVGEVLYRELNTRVKGAALVEETETVVKDSAPDGKSE